MKFLVSIVGWAGFLMFAGSGFLSAQVVSLHTGWTLYPTYDVRREADKIQVGLPHTWNAEDVFGRINYRREAMVYQKKLPVPKEWAGKRLFLYFEGVNSVADVFVNGKRAGGHAGGYTAFCMEITDFITPGQEALLAVWVSNAYRTDVLPLSGDFNVYGGIHRPVRLLVKEANCISPLDYASSGVYISPVSISEKRAEFNVKTLLSLGTEISGLEVRTTIRDASEAKVAEQTTPVTSRNRGAVLQEFEIGNPNLWNGKANPYLYTVTTELTHHGAVLDVVVEKTGFRYFSVHPELGFQLNGAYLDLHGFGRHEDVAGKGSALDYEDYLRDMELILESGATAMRLTHYPHGKPMYDLADEHGIALWTEIPLVGPGGYTGPGYMQSPSLESHIRTTLVELIRQHYNHPSVFFWGLFNELKFDYDNPVPLVQALHQLAKQEDPSRLTTCAAFGAQEEFIGLTDLIAWNEYFGWYGGMPKDMGPFLDKMKAKAGKTPVGISEYGAGANIRHHAWPPEKPAPGGPFHPEEWQTAYHVGNWKELALRKYVWGKFIWVLTDFSSSIRNEGGKPGINDKGLISYDRQTSKDAFYFYKANWNPTPMAYIASRRFLYRSDPVAEVNVFSNADAVELFLNGKSMGTQAPDEFKTLLWKQVRLIPGQNTLEVRAKTGSLELRDSCTWILQKP